MKPPSLAQFPANPQLDYLRGDLVEGWLARYDTLPISYTHIKNYVNEATTTLMPASQAQYIWTFKDSPTKHSKCTIDLWALAVYDVGESLAWFMGLLEYDRTRPGHTRITTHKDQWGDTGDNTQAWFKVLRLNYPGGLQDPNSSVSGIRVYLDVHRE